MNEWTKEDEWHGNPSLNYESWMKTFRNPYTGRKVPVYVFGKPSSLKLHYCVSAGANSEYSYSGCFYPEQLTFQETMNRVDQLYQQGKLFH